MPTDVYITLFRVEVGDFRVVERIVVSSSAEVCNWTAGGMEWLSESLLWKHVTSTFSIQSSSPREFSCLKVLPDGFLLSYLLYLYKGLTLTYCPPRRHMNVLGRTKQTCYRACSASTLQQLSHMFYLSFLLGLKATKENWLMCLNYTGWFKGLVQY